MNMPQQHHQKEFSYIKDTQNTYKVDQNKESCENDSWNIDNQKNNKKFKQK